MATFKASSKKKDNGVGVFKATKNKSYDARFVTRIESENEESSSILNEYINRRKKGEWMSEDELSTYRSALDRFKNSNESLSMLYKRGEGEEKELSDYISYLNSDIDSSSELFKKYSSTDDYKKAIVDFEEYEKNKTANIFDIETEIEGLSKQVEEAKKSDSMWSWLMSDEQKAKKNGYDNFEELESELNEKKQYLESVKYVQDYENNTIEELRKLADEASTNDERLYYLGLSNQKAMEGKEGKTTLRGVGDFVGNTIMSGINAWNKGISSTADLILGKPLQSLGWENNPISWLAKEYDELYDNYAFDRNLSAQKMGWGDAGMYAGQFGEGLIAAVPDAILAFMTGGVSKAGSLAQTAAYASGDKLTKAGLTVQNMMKNPNYWSSFARTYGLDYEEAKAMGASDTAAVFGATISSLVNAGIEIGVDGGSGIQGFAQDLADGNKSKFLSWVESSLEEGGEEILQGFVNNLVAKTMYDDSTKLADLEQMITEGAMGVGIGAILGGGQIGAVNAYDRVAQAVAQNEAYKKHGADIMSGGGVEALQELAKNVAGVTTAKEGKQLSKAIKRAESKTTPKNIGKLSGQLYTVRDSENISDIATALTEGGIPKAQAKKVAEYIYNGTDISDISSKSVRELMESDAVKSVREKINSDDSSVSERNTKHFIGRLGGESAIVEKAAAKSNPISSVKPTVSEDGRAVLRKTGEEITIKGVDHVETIKDDGDHVKGHVGYLKVVNSDGNESVVPSKDVSYASETEGLLYDSFIESDISPAYFNTYMSNFNPNDFLDNDGNVMSNVVTQYALGFQNAYRYGWIGYGKELDSATFAKSLTPLARKAAYDAGVSASKYSTDTKQEALDTAVAERKESGKGKARTKGTLHMDGVKTKKRTAMQNAGIGLAKRLTAIGVDIYLYESHQDAQGNWVDDQGNENDNGFYRGSDGSIHIDINAGRGEKSLMAYTLSHELTHHLRRNNQKGFKEFSDLLYAWYGSKGVSIGNLVTKKMLALECDWDTAYEEVVADFCETFLTDSNIADRIIELQETNNGLWESIKAKVLEFLDWMKSLFVDVDPDSAEGKMARQYKGEIDHLYDAFYNALVDATETFQWIGAGDVNTDAIAVEETTKHSYRSLAEAAGFEAREVDGVRGYYRNGKKVSKVTVEDIEISPIGAMINYSLEQGDIDADAAKRQKEMFAEICTMACQTNDFSMTMQFVGSAVFTGMKANADKQYGTTYDFPSICTKTQAVIDAMSKKMVTLKRGLTQEEILELYQKVFASGNPVPCPECYVFSRWIGIGGLLDNIYEYQTHYGNMSVADAAKAYAELHKKVARHASENGISSFGKAKGALAKTITDKWVKLKEKIEKADNQGEKVKDSDRALLKSLESEMVTVKALTWLDKVYFVENPLDSNGNPKSNPKVNKNYAVPVEVLFDLNKGDEFASKYSEAWGFRTTQGAGYGKAITPYAEAVLGEGILATNNTTKTIKAKAGQELKNPFLEQRGMLDKDARKILATARRKQKIQAFLGGQRFQSTSDARYENASDYLLAALEMQAMHGRVQVYTKVDGAVPAFSAWGFSINQSLMPLGGGLDAKGNVIDTKVGGMNRSVAFKNRENHETAGTITIGVNDNHIRKMFAEIVRDFIIPYHASGGKAWLVNAFRMAQDKAVKKDTFVRSTDYSRTQGDKVLSDAVLKWMGKTDEEIKQINAVREARLAILTGGKPNMDVVSGNRFLSALYDKFNDGEWDGVKVARSKVESQIFPNEFWDESVTYEESGKITQDYLDYCADLGFLHRFSGMVPKNGILVPVNGYNENGERVQLTDLAYLYDENGNKTDKIEPFFWKVLTDRRMYGNDGRYLAQKVVTLNDTTASTVTTFAKKNDGRQYDAVLSMETADKIAGVKKSSRIVSEELDSQYLELAKDPVKNEKQLRKMVQEAALASGVIRTYTKKSGYKPQSYWHYSRTGGGFSSFNIPAWFSESRNYATSRLQTTPFGREDLSKDSKEYYLTQPGGGLVVPNIYGRQVFKGGYFKNKYPFLEGVLEDDKFYGTNQLVEDDTIRRVLVENGISNVYADEDGYKVCIVLDPSQIKSADLVTYDENGDVIPLSQRFDSSKSDIRYSRRDSNGRELTEAQQEFFKDSKVRDAKGNLLVMYHGTKAKFTVFDVLKLDDGLGFFFTEDEREASDYGTPMSSYLNITNPFDMFGNTPITDFLGESPKYIDGHFNWEAVRSGLIDAGYDGVYSYSHGTTWYVAFNSNQIKNTTNTNPTKDPDIRYSRRATDTSYMEAVEIGDMRTVEQMVKEAAEEAGYTRKVYHGSPRKFTKFAKNKRGLSTSSPSAQIGFWLTTNKETAEFYSTPGDAAIVDELKSEKKIAEYQKKVQDLIDEKYSPAYYALRNEVLFGNKSSSSLDYLPMDVIADACKKYLPAMYYNLEGIWPVGPVPDARHRHDRTGREVKASSEEFLDYLRYYYHYDGYSQSNEMVIKNFLDEIETGMLRAAQLELGVMSPTTMALYAKTENPLIVTDHNTEFGDINRDEVKVKMIRKAVKDGHDSLIIRGIIDGGAKSDHVVVFNPEQIKSADPVTYDDKGKVIPLSKRFDKKKEDIRYSKRQKAPTFYSYMGVVADGLKDGKYGAASIINMLKGKGVKDEEIKWSGIEAWLDGKKSVTKAELQEFIAGSQLQIGEQMSGFNQDAYDELAAMWQKHTGVPLSATFSDDFDLQLTPGSLMDQFEWMEKEGYVVPTYEDQSRMMDLARQAGDKGRWSKYKLDGGTNYREIVFTMPNSIYSNNAMQAHWGQDAGGVLAHARIQDFVDADGRRMLFVEEIQSDWHNAGNKQGYVDKTKMVTVKNTTVKHEDGAYRLYRGEQELHAHFNDSALRIRFPNGITEEQIHEGLVEQHNSFSEGTVPDAPFRNTYHEYVLKRLIRMAAEEGYDSIGWTTADTQSDRWSETYAEGYRIEYDQEIPKFLRKYGKKWGATVGKTHIPTSKVEGEHDWLVDAAELPFDTDGTQYAEEAFANFKGVEVWSMPITDSMKDSVLYEGQVMYQRRGTSLTPRAILANALESAVQNEDEARRLAEYKEQIELYEADEQKLRKIRARIHELSFTPPKEGEKKDTKAIATLSEEARKLATNISTYDKRLLRLEAAAPLRSLLARETERVRREEKQRGRERLTEYREDRLKSGVRLKIKRFKADLENTLLRGTERKYVPVDLVQAMVDVCDLIDTDTPLYKADGTINKAQQKRELTKERLQALRDEYENLKTNSDPLYAGEFDEQVYEYIKELRDNFGGKNIREMNLRELEELYLTLRSIGDTLQDARKLIGVSASWSIYEAADLIAQEQAAVTATLKKGKRSAGQKAVDSIDNLSLSPVRNVERMSGYAEGSVLVDLFTEFEKGVRKKNKFSMDAYKSFEKLTSGKEYDHAVYDAFGNEYEDINGRKFRLSKMQMMQAILSYEREKANGMDHIQGSGFSFADLDMLRKGKMRDAVSEEYSHRVPAASWMVGEFQEALKSDEWCQAYMTAAREFFNGSAKDAINETTVTLKHRVIARDKSYIPFEVDKNFVVREISAEDSIQQTINAYGMLKETKKGASQPLIITGLNNILERHIEQVGNVYGLAIPVRNFNKVWNARTMDVTGSDPTVKAAIQRNWGVEGAEHIEQTVKDLQGRRPDTQSDIYRFVKSGYISSTFTLNLSVVSKQIGSLFSATSMLRWRDPARMVGNLLYTMANHKKISAEVDKYTATAWMRRSGMSDAELHTLTTMAKKPGLFRLMSKAPAIVNPVKWITAMDHAVALSLWRYAKQDTAKRTGLKGEELLKATAEFYDEVVENTQSMTDVLHRPEIQKRGDVVSEAFGMFKTDLFQMAGQLKTAVGRFMADKSADNAKALGRTAYATLMQTLWGQLMVAVYALLRYKVKPYRDDDDEELTVESWLKRQSFGLVADIMGYFVPLFGSESVGLVESIIYGESADAVDSLALTAVNDLIDTFVSVGSSIKDGEMPDTEQMEKLTTKALQLFGVPANNIIRTIDAINLHAQDIANGEFLSFEASAETPNARGVYDSIVSGDDEREESVRDRFKDESTYESAMKKGLRENDPRIREALKIRVTEGTTNKYHKIREDIINDGDFEQSIVNEALKAEYNYFNDKVKEAADLLKSGDKKASDDIIRELKKKYKGTFTQDDILKAVKKRAGMLK